MLVGGKIQAFDPQQIFHGAGDVVTLSHLGGAGDGAYDPQLANTGGVCAYADAGTTAQTTSGKTLTCTEKDGSYSWQG